MTINHVLMCHPGHFRVDYSINPWMEIGSVNSEIASFQWDQLLSSYQKAGLRVSIIQQEKNFPDMVFATDEGLFLEKSLLLLSNFKYHQRRGETEIFEAWFEKNGFALKKLSTPRIYFEGSGDCLIWKPNSYFLGSGHRNSPNLAPKLKSLTNKEFISLKLIHPHFFHLDTCLFILNQQTAFYYPPAFDQSAIKHLTENFTNLISVSEKEANNFGLNCVTHKNSVFIQKNNPALCKQLKALNYLPIELDLSEFQKAGGGIHCLTQILDYDL